MMDWYGGMGDGGWVLMGLFWLVLLAAIVWGVSQLSLRRPPAPGEDEAADPHAILDRRLARGEIDPATYDALRGKLDEAHAPTTPRPRIT